MEHTHVTVIGCVLNAYGIHIVILNILQSLLHNSGIDNPPFVTLGISNLRRICSQQ
ncbi:hypothetical protein D3C75_816160 [compost metagenome]